MKQYVDCFQKGECFAKRKVGKACMCRLLKHSYAANQKCPFQKKDPSYTNGIKHPYNRPYVERKKKEEAEEEAAAVAAFEERKRRRLMKGMDLIDEDHVDDALTVLKESK